jgi:hypothetical protein
VAAGLVYELHFLGGPRDGAVAYSPRPYDRITDGVGLVYAADREGPECLEWVDDGTRRITLRYRGRVSR